MNYLKRNLTNIPGWTTRRKFVVFESDDWGSIRMPSRLVHEQLRRLGLRVDLCPYNRFDNLESSEDLCRLYEVLAKYRDCIGNHPIMTLNVNTANPNFELIEESGYVDYYYEKFTDTLVKYYPKGNVIDLWHSGIEEKLIYPQYHHREHVNACIWLELLRNGNEALRLAFKFGVYGLSMVTSPLIDVPYLASLLYRGSAELEKVRESIVDGALIFKSVFGFVSKSFIAPLNVWTPTLEMTLWDAGIRYIQGANVQKVYKEDLKSFSRIYHSVGSTSVVNQIYLNRNCRFEPSIDAVNYNLCNVIKQIETAFFWRKPAVICTHRLNYVGSIYDKNASNNLEELSQLLDVILKRWPDVEFISSEKLGELIESEIE